MSGDIPDILDVRSRELDNTEVLLPFDIYASM